jgi:plastocyanin
VLLLAGLSTGNKIGLAVVGAVFILFALTSTFIAPRKRPDFPGRNGLSVFVIASIVLFAAMLTAVAVFDRESEAKGAEKTAGARGSQAAATMINVIETEFKVQLPAEPGLKPGRFTFVVQNAGKIQHDLAISGGSVAGPSKTPLLDPGKSAKLTVSLQAGNYTLYCTVPGHKQAGMVAKLAVH